VLRGEEEGFLDAEPKENAGVFFAITILSLP
jgi:hypothetical protein